MSMSGEAAIRNVPPVTSAESVVSVTGDPLEEVAASTVNAPE